MHPGARFSPLSGIKFAESLGLANTGDSYIVVSVPFRGLSSRKENHILLARDLEKSFSPLSGIKFAESFAIISTTWFVGLFQSPFGD